MTNNVDLEIDLDDVLIEDLLNIYIRTHMTSGSYEIFQREKEHQLILDAAAKAVLNEAIVEAIKIGMEINTAKEEYTKPTEDRVIVVINDNVHNYPVGRVLSYDEISSCTGCKKPIITINLAGDSDSDTILFDGQGILVENGMIINAKDLP